MYWKQQISLDCMFLESQCIIDYSLLLGVHFRAPENLKTPLCSPEKVHTNLDLVEKYCASSKPKLLPSPSLRLVTHEPSSVSRLPGSHIRGSTLRVSFKDNKEEVDILLSDTGRLRVQLGVNMPAVAKRKLSEDGDADDPTKVDFFEVYDVVLYLALRNGFSEARGVIRDSEGKLVMAYNVVPDKGTNTIPDTYGLLICKTYNLLPVVVESDRLISFYNRGRVATKFQ
ncbi:hypothetical protein GIB67_000798, partial [Kingdonia uniflora]